MTSHSQHVHAICKLFRSCEYRHDRHRLFADCMETIAMCLSNSIDLRHREARERRYLEIVGHYDRKILDIFPKIFGEVVLAFETEPGDVLGEVYGELELHSADKGQFFTPYTVCRMMAQVLLGNREEAMETIRRNGFVRAIEPACGAGAMIIALAETMRAEGINYQRHLDVIAVDIDPRAVHMAFIQFTLLHVPAIVIVGDSLRMEARQRWHTPAHILGGWSAKLADRDAELADQAIIDPPAEERHRGEQPPSATSPNAPKQLTLF